MSKEPVVERSADRVIVEFTPDLGRRLRDLAARERRTIKAQLEILLERALEGESVA